MFLGVAYYVPSGNPDSEVDSCPDLGLTRRAVRLLLDGDRPRKAAAVNLGPLGQMTLEDAVGLSSCSFWSSSPVSGLWGMANLLFHRSLAKKKVALMESTLPGVARLRPRDAGQGEDEWGRYHRHLVRFGPRSNQRRYKP